MKEIKFTVDKRTELMEVLLYISNYRKEYPELVLYNKDFEYVKDVYNAFSKFSNHKAVLLLNEIVEKCNFCYDAPFVLAMQLNDDFSVGKLLNHPFVSRLKSAPVVEEFMNEIADFAKKSEFEKFYEAHLGLYESIINKWKSSTKLDQLAKFEEFYKIDTNREYIVNFLPLCAQGNGFFDYSNDNYFVCYLVNNHKNDLILLDKLSKQTYTIFYTFTLCQVRNLVDNNKIKVPKNKEFSEILKTKYTTISNLQFVCREISEVLSTIFGGKVFNFDVKPFLDQINPNNKERVYKIYDILMQWQKSDEPLENYLQRLVDLF